MGVFSEALQRHLNRDEATLKASGAETTSTVHSSHEMGDHASLTVVVDVTVVGGTSTLIVKIEGSEDGQNWFELGRIGKNGYVVGPLASAPTAFDGVDTERAVFACPRFVRSSSTITDTSVTYSITATAAG